MGFPARAVAGVFLGLWVAAGQMAMAEEPLVYAPGGIALSGYDAVSYFESEQPLRGMPENAIMWRGVTWYFASPDSLMSFEMNPQHYAPQFGGYCTYAVAQGRTASSAPDAFIVIDGRLYFMHNAEMITKLRGELPRLIEAAQSHWPAALASN